MKKITLILSFFLFINLLSAQCLLQEVSLQQRVQEADIIFEGKVLGKNSFWNQQHNYIYTATTVEIYKVFKGNPEVSEVKIITEGGMVGLQGTFVNPVLKLSKEQTGLFFGSALTTSLPVEGILFSPYAGPQGFVEYDLVEDKAVDAFATYENISENFYSKITSLTGKKYHEVRPFHASQPSQDRSAAPAITGFSPNVLAAGVGAVLTINGSGFGATQGAGYVSFKNADNGGSTYVNITEPLYYVSWSDAMIRIRVPGDVWINTVGTGTIRVTNSSAQTGTSSTPLTVLYSRFESVYQGIIYSTFLYDSQNNGGYMFNPTSAIATNTSAVNAFKRALTTWNCANHIKWELSSVITTADSTGGDGISVVRYAPSSEFPGAAAFASYQWIGVSDGLDLYLAITEMDVSFISSLNWCYGPANPSSSQIDFETAALHELGHCQTLQHVIDNTDVLHFQMPPPPQTRRTLLWNDVQGGNNVINLGQSVAADCGLPPMILFYDPLCPVGIENYSQGTSSGPVYPNPASGITYVNIPGITAAARIEVYNSLGEQFPVYLTTDNTLDVSSLSNGIYFLRISDSGTSASYMFSIAK